MKSKFRALSFRFQPVITVCCSLFAALGATQSAHAVDYTFTPPATGTGGTVNWSTGTFWDVTPVSGIDTRLLFGGTLDAAAPVVTNNDVANPFQLNNLTFNASGPATGVAPTYTISGSQLQFISNGAVTPTMTLNAGGTVKPSLTISSALLLTNDLTINPTTNGTFTGVISGAGNLTINGPGTITLGTTAAAPTSTFGGSGKTITVTGGATLRVNAPDANNFTALGSTSNTLVLNGGGFTYQPSSDPTVTFQRAIDLQTGGTNIIDAAGTAGNRGLAISGPITGSGGFSTAGVIIGLLNASGGNTLTGTVTAANSTLFVASNASRDALGGANLTLAGANTIFTGSAGTVAIADFGRNISVTSNSSLGAGNNYTFTQTGTLTGSSTLSINTGQTGGFTSSGINSQIVNAGSGSVVVLNGNLSGFSGGLTVSNGTLRFGSSATLPGTLGLLNFNSNAGILADLNGRNVTVAGISGGASTGGNIQGNATGAANTLTTVTNAIQSYGGSISNGGAVPLNFTKLGTATQTLTGINTYTGTTTINGGTLATTTGASTTARINGGGALALGGGTLAVTGTTVALSASTQTFSGTTLNSGLSTVSSTVGAAGLASNIALGAITRNTGSQVNFTLPTTGSITTETANTATTILGGWATVAGNDFATSAGAPSTPGAITAYTGYTTQNVATNFGTAGNTGDITNSANITGTAPTGTINSLRFNSGGQTLNIGSGNTLTIASGGILVTSVSGATTIAGGNLQGTAATGLTLSTNVGQGLTVSSVIRDNGGATALSISGPNFLTLAGPNTYTGQTYINSGWGRIGSNANLGDVNTGATLNINGGNLFYDLVVALENAGANKRDVVIGAKGATFRPVTSNGVSGLLVSGVISGTDFGSLTVGSGGSTSTTNRGSLTLTGANTYNGNTIISGAAVNVANSATQATTLVLGNDSALGTGSLIFAGVAGTSNVLGLETNGAVGTTRTIANALGAISGTGVTLRFGSATTGDLSFTNTTTASLGTSATRTFQVDNAKTTFANGFSGTSSAITKTGTGALVLNGANTYTGATTVSNGTLLVGDSVGSTASIGSAAALNVTAATATLGGHGFINSSTTLTNGATLSAGTSAGSLEFGSSLNLAAGNTLIELGGTTFTLNGTEQYDRIKMSGLAASSLTLGGTLNVNLINSFALAANQVFGIFQLDGSASRTGIFASLGEGASLGTLGGSQELFITYVADVTDNTISRFGGNDIALYTIPEPSSALLLLGGLGMLLGFRRR